MLAFLALCVCWRDALPGCYAYFGKRKMVSTADGKLVLLGVQLKKYMRQFQLTIFQGTSMLEKEVQPIKA